MLWRVYINYSLSGSFKYNFEGSKTDLMTLIGVIHSKSLEACRVDYKEVIDFDLTIETISYVITSDKVYIRLRSAGFESIKRMKESSFFSLPVSIDSEEVNKK